jgi:hypothetical protein
MDQLARDKEAKLANEAKLTERKKVLNDKITNCTGEEKKVSSSFLKESGNH